MTQGVWSFWFVEWPCKIQIQFWSCQKMILHCLHEERLDFIPLSLQIWWSVGHWVEDPAASVSRCPFVHGQECELCGQAAVLEGKLIHSKAWHDVFFSPYSLGMTKGCKAIKQSSPKWIKTPPKWVKDEKRVLCHVSVRDLRGGVWALSIAEY